MVVSIGFVSSDSWMLSMEITEGMYPRLRCFFRQSKTPKAVLSPVRLAGTTVTNATLHNQDFITEKDIRIGDTVLVQKAGEIIPEILSVDLTKRPEGTVPYTLPDTCPVCGNV